MVGGQVKVLLVEDNPSDVELTLRALKKNNIVNEVEVVGDGQQALDFVFSEGEFSDRDKNNLPKVVLLDLKLPKVSGLEVLKKIKSDEKTKRIPIVVLTSSKEEKDMIESYKLGVNSYIQKPVDFNEFVKAISEVGLYWLILNKLPD